MVWQVRCHNSITLLLTDNPKSFFMAVNLLIKCEREEVLLFVLHASTCRRNLIVCPMWGIYIDTCAPEILQVVTKFHIKLPAWKRMIELPLLNW